MVTAHGPALPGARGSGIVRDDDAATRDFRTSLLTRRPALSTGGRAEERDLARRASRGDVQAFRRLVEEYSGLVYRVALRILGEDEARDASQDVWVRVWRNIKGFRGESAFSTWLYKITVNTCLNVREREARRREREYAEGFPEVISRLSAPSGGDADPESAALGAERREEIHEALLRVRAEHRAALVLRHMEGLSYAEISDVLEVPNGTAKGWVARGRTALLVALSEENGDGDAGGGEATG